MHTLFRSSSLPKIWKIAEIRPVFKIKGIAEDVNYYRLKSVTSVVFKLLEKILLNTSMIISFKVKYCIKFSRGFKQVTSRLIS